jgi:hypothetical protein
MRWALCVAFVLAFGTAVAGYVGAAETSGSTTKPPAVGPGCDVEKKVQYGPNAGKSLGTMHIQEGERVGRHGDYTALYCRNGKLVKQAPAKQ